MSSIFFKKAKKTSGGDKEKKKEDKKKQKTRKGKEDKIQKNEGINEKKEEDKKKGTSPTRDRKKKENTGAATKKKKKKSSVVEVEELEIGEPKRLFLHSTKAIPAILKSGVFKGTNKQMAKLGMSAAELRIAKPNTIFETLFVEWNDGDLANSLSRLDTYKKVKGDVRGVLVCEIPEEILEVRKGYPAVLGMQVPLAQANLVGVYIVRDDLNKKITLKKLEKLARAAHPGAQVTFGVGSLADARNPVVIDAWLRTI